MKFLLSFISLGIFVDPTYRHCLSPDQQAVGKNALMDLVLHLENAESNKITVEISDTSLPFGKLNIKMVCLTILIVIKFLFSAAQKLKKEYNLLTLRTVTSFEVIIF